MENLYILYIARDIIADDREIYGRLHIFYDTPVLDHNGIWGAARVIGEIPSYMFPNIKERQCRKFISVSNDVDNTLPIIVNLFNKLH